MHGSSPSSSPSPRPTITDDIKLTSQKQPLTVRASVPVSIRGTIAKLQREIGSLYERLTNNTVDEQPLKTAVTSIASHETKQSLSSSRLPRVRQRRHLKGFGRIQDSCWHRYNPRTIMCAVQTGCLVFLDAYRDRSLHTISLQSQYVLTCLWSPSHQYVAHGGLDNIVTVRYAPDYHPSATTTTASSSSKGSEQKIESKRNPSVPLMQLNFHNAMITALYWTNHSDSDIGGNGMNDDYLLSASADGTIAAWDIHHPTLPIRVVSEHDGPPIGTMAVNGHGTRTSLVASGGDSGFIRLFDWRVPSTQAVMTLRGHTDEIAQVAWMPMNDTIGGHHVSETVLASCSHDETVRLWDIRAVGQLHCYQPTSPIMPNRMAFSRSGHGIFVGGERSLVSWDVLTGDVIQTWSGHTSRVTSLSLSSDGKALLTTSFDRTAKIWA